MVNGSLLDEGCSTAESIRAITPEELAHFRKNGWARLDGLISKELAAHLLGKLQDLMGVDGQRQNSNRLARKDHEAQDEGAYAQSTRGGAIWGRPAAQPGPFADLVFSPEVGNLFKTVARQEGRYYTDAAYVKLPSAPGEGQPTRWHQDFPFEPIDHSGGFAIWMALDDIAPEQGTMRFLSGSHRSGVWGNYSDPPKPSDVLADHPYLAEEYEISPPLHLKAGDATIHSSLVVHSAPENTLDKPRWSYLMHLWPAAAYYTGQLHTVTDGIEGLKPWSQVPDGPFPPLGRKPDFSQIRK